jgi:peptidoglycan hydrolase-like protein with peptidoglycan-binding domain
VSVTGRRRVLVVTVTAALLVTAVTAGAARLIKSPAQALAEAAPPPPSVITVKVERRVLVDTVVLRGMVAAEQTVEVAPHGDGEGTPVVTAVRVKPGDQVRAGAVLVEVSGRPVFALPGRIPVYRDLRPGGQGADIRQLQGGLQAQGFGSGDPPGFFGEGTKAAVRRFYLAKGYEPLPASQEDDDLLQQAQDAVTEAARALRDAREALAAARQGGSVNGGAPDPRATAPPSLAQAAHAVEDRTQDLAVAGRRLAAVRERTGPMVPAGELVFLRGFPARVDGVQVAVGSRATGKLVTVSAGRLVVRSQLSPQQRELVRPGKQVRLYADLLGVRSAGRVRSVSDTPTQPDQADGGASDGSGQSEAPIVGDSFEMVAVPTGRLDPRTAGQDIRVTVVAATTRVPVLTVPLTAVSAGADGSTTVTVVRPDGVRRRVEVRPGATGDGYVQVSPTGGALRPGDQVLVGVRA